MSRGFLCFALFKARSAARIAPGGEADFCLARHTHPDANQKGEDQQIRLPEMGWKINLDIT